MQSLPSTEPFDKLRVFDTKNEAPGTKHQAPHFHTRQHPTPAPIFPPLWHTRNPMA